MRAANRFGTTRPAPWHAAEARAAATDARSGKRGAGRPQRQRGRPSQRTSPAATRLAGRRGEHQDELAELLTGYLERDGRSLNQIAQEALLDVAYLWRLKRGQRCRPSRNTLIRLGMVLKLELEELDSILLAVEYAPVTV